jgi:Leucine-rich repeat (LRR) protein
MGMKQILVMMAAVVLVGCGGKEAPESQEKAKSMPRAAVKKRLTKEESAIIIEKAIREELNMPTGELTKEDYKKVTELIFHPTDNQAFLTEVPKGLEKLDQLKDLALWKNKLTDVKGLEKLTQLTELSLNENKLTDVKGLEKLTQLTYLDLEYNQLTNVKGLEKLTKLEELYLRYNPDLTFAQIDELQKALPKCKISSNPRLNSESSAKVIGAAIRKAAKKPTGELTTADLEKVTELGLGSIGLTGVRGLEKLTNLEGLYLYNNQLTSVKGLEKLTQLKTLELQGNPDLAKAQIDELQKALPNCKIGSNPTK